MSEKKKGFTLVEIMVVMAIIAVLATLILGAIQLARTTATETAHRTNAKTIQTALEANYAKYRAYCSDSSKLKCPLNPTSGISFEKAADETNGLSVSLAKSINTTATACISPNGARAGGGAITYLSANAYVIHTANAACSNWTSFDDVIQVNMAAKTLNSSSWTTSDYVF
jgi:prepilin-type N-terminal cleavage/methylation domain-containing protein